MRVTVVGARGFIGSHLAAHARGRGADVIERRHADFLNATPRDPLGTVFYCSGITVGADAEPLRAFEVHVEALRRLINSRSYDKLIYLSSTRVYDYAEATAESTHLPSTPNAATDTYVASKLAGEAVTLAARVENRVVRLSNVFGAGMNPRVFLSDILAQAKNTGIIRLHSALSSAKDYVSVSAACRLTWEIGTSSRERIYNVASGTNTSHQEILTALAALLPLEVFVDDDAPLKPATPIAVQRIAGEFGASPSDLLAELPTLLAAIS
jgi:nucleoside-diphosphate-sugar epimerase